MTDADKNRAVALAIGQRAHYYRGNSQPYLIAKDGSVGEKFDPLHNPAQCIEALNRKFPDGWSYFYRPGEARPDRRHVIAMGIGNGPTFCAAGVAAILAAAKEENHA